MNPLVLYLLLLKATLTSFSGLASLPVIRADLVTRHRVLTDRQLSTAVAAGRTGPGPIGLYVVSVGYFVAGVPGAVAGWLAMITPAFLIVPLLAWLGHRAGHPAVRRVIRSVVLASAGLLLASTVPLAMEVVTGAFALVVTLASLAVLVFTKIDTVWVMLGAAAAGLLRASVI